MPAEKRTAWNSLEAAKLLVGIATPLALALLGFRIQATLAKQNEAWRSRERLADRRLAVYDEIRKPINQIYCYIEDVGTYKDDTPPTIIVSKRSVDQTMFTNEAIWSSDTLQAYRDYMQSAFLVFSGVNQDAQIRTSFAQKATLDGWNNTWVDRFTGTRARDHSQRYNQLMKSFSRDLMLQAVAD